MKRFLYKIIHYILTWPNKLIHDLLTSSPGKLESKQSPSKDHVMTTSAPPDQTESCICDAPDAQEPHDSSSQVPTTSDHVPLLQVKEAPGMNEIQVLNRKK